MQSIWKNGWLLAIVLILPIILYAAYQLSTLSEDEENLAAPVVSLSLGDTAVFRIGGPERKGRTRSFRLSSGDALVLSGPSRFYYHGVDRVIPGSSTLLPDGGRINLTLRRVTELP